MAPPDDDSTQPPEPSGPESVLRALEDRLERASDAAERLIAEAASAAARRTPAAGQAAPGDTPAAGRAAPSDTPAAGWAAPGDTPPNGSEVPAPEPDADDDLGTIISLVRSLRDLIPPDLQKRLAEALRELLLAVRALIDWYLERLEQRRKTPTPVEDIPIF